MNDERRGIQNLLPKPGEPVFDPEGMTLELLHHRLMNWLDRFYFDVGELRPLRGMVRDLSGLPPEERSDTSRIPDTLHRMHCIEYARLSPLSKREGFRLALEYIGLAEGTAGELLGEDCWAAVRAKIDCRCGQKPVAAIPDSGSSAPPSAARSDPWTSRVLMTQLLNLVDEQSFFNICDFERVERALSDLRAALGLTVLCNRQQPQRAALRALHCVDFKSMDPVVKAELPSVILATLGLDEVDGPKLLGPADWDTVQERYRQGIELCPKQPETELCAAQPEPYVSVFIRVWKKVRW